MSGKTVIIGASPNPSRYAYLAAGRLISHGHKIVPLSIRRGVIFGQEIQDIRMKPGVEDVDTVTLYIGPRHQPEWYDYILGLKARRVIFNPGTENEEFAKRICETGTEAIEACTLVMLRTGQY